MKKQTKQHEIEDFVNHIHLWNIPSTKGLTLLQKIVDSIQYNYYKNPGKQLPSVLINGEIRNLLANAFINSLQIEDVRECPGYYLDNGINSSQLFEQSLYGTAHLITDIEYLTTIGQSVIWKYLKERKCTYYNFMTKDYSKIIHCNGLIVLTANKPNVSKSIKQRVDYCINTDMYSFEELRQFACQQLQFCGITYRGQAVIDEIVENDLVEFTSIMQLIKTCIMLVEADVSPSLTVKIVKEAKRLCALQVPPDHDDDDDIPF